MGSLAVQKPHAVLLPHPFQGHINPMMKLAKLLHSRGFHITFVNTEFNHKRLIMSSNVLESLKGVQDFRFETIPDGLPSQEFYATGEIDIPTLVDSMRKTCLVPFKQLLEKLMKNSSLFDHFPSVSCVISDGLMSFGIKAAQDMGIPQIFQFWTASAAAFIGCLHYRELVKRGIVPFKNDDFLIDNTLNKPVDWISGMSNVRLRDLPSFLRTTEPNDIMFDFMGEEAQSCLKAPAIIFNTIDELEQEALDAVKNKFNYPNIYTIGPLSLLGTDFLGETKINNLNSSLWKPDSNVFDWLNSQEKNSVIYVNYGSITTMTRQHFIEFAWGLADSKQPFLWIVRPDVVKDEGGKPTSLPDDFLEEVKGRGMITSWCAQDQVLVHPAVGAFLSHCGWNSTMDTVCAGVPVICWPFFADQQTNCHYVCEKWKIGKEINQDVKREEVSEAVCKMMVTGEEGDGMRKKAKELKKIAEKGIDVEGSSYNNFEKLVKKAIRF